MHCLKFQFDMSKRACHAPTSHHTCKSTCHQNIYNKEMYNLLILLLVTRGDSK